VGPASRELGSGRPPGGKPATAALFVGALAFSLVLAEFALRLGEADAWRVWPPNLERTLTPDPLLLPGVSGPSRFSTNAWGMRGDPWNESARQHILAVGGSTTICVYLDDSEAWPHLVQDMLNEASAPDQVWVGNVGRPGHTTVQHLLQLEKLLQQHPEIDTVLLMVGANDFLIQLVQRSASVWAVAAAPNASDRPPLPTNLHHPFSQFPADNSGPWYRRSALVRALLTRPWRGESLEGLPLLDDSGRFYEEGRERRRQAVKFLDTLLDMTGAHRQFVRNLDRIVDLTQAAGVRLILVTQPSLWDADLSPSELDLLWAGGPPPHRPAPGAPFYSAAALAEGMAAYNRLLLQLCDRRGIECIDAAEGLPKSSEIFFDGGHFTEEGSRRLAGLIAGALLKADASKQRGAGTRVP